MDPGLKIARQIFFTGKVQGVGFRARAEKLSKSFKVEGYVQNLEDGRVELWIEGDEAELDRFEHAIEQSMQNFIEDIDSSDQDPKGVDGFAIKLT